MKVKILSTSDVHGYVLPTNYSRRDDHQDYGWLKVATVIQEVQQRATSDEIVITIENGDWIQGSAFASYLAQQSADQQALFTQLTRSIHYDAGVLGNHEFNYGLDYLRNCERQRNYPLLGANVQGGVAQEILDGPYTIVEERGIKIAILGLTTAYVPVWERADHLTGLTFTSALATAKRFVPQLRLADVVIVATTEFEADLRPGSRRNDDGRKRRISSYGSSGIDALVTANTDNWRASITGFRRRSPVKRRVTRMALT